MDIERINEMIGVDRSKLNEENSKEIVERLEFKLAEIREKFFVNLPANFKEKEDFIDRAKSIKGLVSKFEDLKTECKQMERTLAKYEKKSEEHTENEFYKELEPLCLNAIQNKRLTFYVKYLAKLEELKQSIETEIANIETKSKKTINKSDPKQLIQEAKSHNEIDILVDNLFAAYIKFQDFVELIIESNCANLKRYSIQTLNYLDQRIRPILVKNFEWFLQLLSFPNLAQVQESKTSAKSSSHQTAQEKGESQELHALNEHNINLFVAFIDRLIRIDFKLNELNQRDTSNTRLQEEKKTILVIELLARPLDIRFRFHFFTNRKTNNIEKPEWYLSQILEWIKNQEPFMSKYVQPSFDKSEYLRGKSALIELANCLVGLIKEKIALDLESLIKNPAVFSHTIDELLEFNSQYKNFIGYLEKHYTNKCYTTLHVLCENADMLEQWINLERDVCQKKVDNLFSCLNRDGDSSLANDEKANIFSLSNKSENEIWSCNYSDIDLMKPPHCAESFVLLIKAITDRYTDLPYSSKKLKFFQLQVELFNDFHMRLCQIREEAKTPLSRNYLGVLNTANYIIYILEEWKYNPFYSEINSLLKKYDQFVRKLELTSGKSFKREENSASEDSILPGNEDSLRLFDEHMQAVNERDELRDKADLSGIMEKDVHVFDSYILVSYSKVHVEMINTIAQTCKWEITSRSRLYKKEKWMNMPSPSEYTKPTLTQSAADMLISLKNLFNLLKESLSVYVVDSILKRITHELDMFIYEEIILQSQFNENGALQLQYDINKYLLPILNEFAHKIKIEEFFKNTRDSLILLTLKVGSGFLLKEILNKALMDDAQLELNNESCKNKLVYEANKALKDFGVIKLDIQQAKEVLDLRCDFVINKN